MTQARNLSLKIESRWLALGIAFVANFISSGARAAESPSAIEKARNDYFEALVKSKAQTPAQIEQLKKQIIAPALDQDAKAQTAKTNAEIEALRAKPLPTPTYSPGPNDFIYPKSELKPDSPAERRRMEEEDAGPPSTDPPGTNVRNLEKERAAAAKGAGKANEPDDGAQDSARPAPVATEIPVKPRPGPVPETPTNRNEPVVSGTGKVDTVEFKKSVKAPKGAKKPTPEASASPEPAIAPSGSGQNVDEVTFEKPAKPSPTPSKPGNGASKKK
jgi:hypothetical protein